MDAARVLEKHALIMLQLHPTTGPVRFSAPVRFLVRKAEWNARRDLPRCCSCGHIRLRVLYVWTRRHLYFCQINYTRPPRDAWTGILRTPHGTLQCVSYYTGPVAFRTGPVRVYKNPYMWRFWYKYLGGLCAQLIICLHCQDMDGIASGIEPTTNIIYDWNQFHFDVWLGALPHNASNGIPCFVITKAYKTYHIRQYRCNHAIQKTLWVSISIAKKLYLLFLHTFLRLWR